jgi:hypothetical protein
MYLPSGHNMLLNTTSGNITLDRNNQQTIKISNDLIEVSVSGSTWTLDNTGNLQLPLGGTINDSDGFSVLGGGGGGASTGNITFSDTTMASTNGDVKIGFSPSASPAVEFTFATSGNLVLPKGSILSETANTTVITPPNALAGQSLVVRLTGAQGIISDHPGGFADGDTVTLTVTPDYNYNTVTGTVDYTFTGCTSVELGRALTGTLTFTNETSKPISWTIPVSSTMTTFTITLSNASGFDISGIAPLTLTKTGSSEDHHIHLIAGDPSITDIYLGDDDQYVKIEKNGGNVIIGTSTNTKQWKFDTDGNLTLPAGGDIKNSSGTSVLGTTLYLLEAYASETYTLPGSFTEDTCRYSVVSSNVNVSSSWFNTSTYTFTPLKAGYWQITASYDIYRNSEASIAIKKNTDIVAAAGSFNSVAQQVTKIIYLNGSTDYINIINVGAAALSRAQYDSRSWFQARWIGQ